MAKLFYIIGASGAGKDSLIDYLRRHIPAEAGVMFAHRYITRPAYAGGENHVALSLGEFVQRKKHGCFAMDWYSHATHYGVGIEINEWMQRGLDVVVNGSRQYLKEAAQRYPNLVPVLIRVKPEVLRDRLVGRGRENAVQISKRLAQAVQLEQEVRHPALVKVDNNTKLEDAGERLLKVILEQVKAECA